MQRNGKIVAMVGHCTDILDSLILGKADVGIAIKSGSDYAINTANIEIIKVPILNPFDDITPYFNRNFCQIVAKIIYYLQ